jgi:hypothetical protein
MFSGYWSRKRNINRNIALLRRPNTNDPNSAYYGLDGYDLGQQIYAGGARAEFRSGNCYEMSCVAVYIAHTVHNYPMARLWIASLTGDGDHCFLIISTTDPAQRWASAGAMTGAAGASGDCFIDPWLNSAGTAEEYWPQVRAKLRKWSQDGKRVFWMGPGGNAPGWYDPAGTYLPAFQGAGLAFNQA